MFLSSLKLYLLISPDISLLRYSSCKPSFPSTSSLLIQFLLICLPTSHHHFLSSFYSVTKKNSPNQNSFLSSYDLHEMYIPFLKKPLLIFHRLLRYHHFLVDLIMLWHLFVLNSNLHFHHTIFDFINILLMYLTGLTLSLPLHLLLQYVHSPWNLQRC